jgi:O-antigen/teichoic acid export membrane protein
MMVRTFWVFLDKFIKLAGGFLVGIWVTRYLGPERFGIINQGLLVLALCTAYLPGALKYYAIKECGADTPEGQQRYVAAIAQLSLLTVLGMVVGAGIFLFGGFATDEQIVGLILLSQAGVYLFSAVKYQAEARSDFKQLVVMENIGFVAAGLLKLLVIELDGGLYWMAWTYAADTVLASVYMAWIIKRRPQLNVFPQLYQSLKTGRYWQNVSDTLPPAGDGVSVYFVYQGRPSHCELLPQCV